jgi:AraC-like DNA-binding protein
LTFGLIERTVGEIGWCHKNVSTDDLLVFSPGGDNDCVSKPGFRGHLVSYSEEHLERIAADLELPLNLGPYREGGVALQVDPDEAEDLRHRLRRLDRAVTECSEDVDRRLILHELEHEIPVRLLHLLATKPPTTPSLVDGFKARAARKARDFIDAHADEAPTIQDACRTAGVSWRTLNYAFREVFGVTPKQYLQATRLDGVRKELHRKGPASTVTDIANDWGFWHMGQFAADYRRQFGELPSETVRRAQKPGA